MINLLPGSEKKQILAGQSNVLLLRYCIISVILAAGLSVYIGISYFLIMNSKAGAEKIIEENNSRVAQYSDVQKQAKELDESSKVAKTILEKEVPYSKITVKIAQLMPPNVILDTLNLDVNNFGQPMTLNAKGKTYQDAIELKTRFEESDLFSDVHLEFVGQGESDDGYSVSININVTINPEVAKQ